MTRWRSCSGSAIRADRSSTSSRRRATIARSTFPIAKLSHRDRNAGPEGFKPAGFEDALRYRTDFSFSGVKTAVMRYVKQRNAELGVVTTTTSAASMPAPAFSEQELADVCASFQRAVVEALVDRTFDAARWLEAQQRRHRRRRVREQPPPSGRRRRAANASASPCSCRASR